MATLRLVRPPALETRVVVEKEFTVIGRNPDCDLVIPVPAVAREHCRIARREGWFALEDLRSRSGTYLNGQQVLGLSPLTDGDRFRVCDCEVVFESPLGAMTEAEWLASGNAQFMLTWLRSHVDASERRLRLFAVACYRHGRLPWPKEASGALAERAERLAEENWSIPPGEAGHGPLWAADAWQAAVDSAREVAETAFAPLVWVDPAARPGLSPRRRWEERWEAFVKAEGLLCRLVRDVFGNPFRAKPLVEPAWQDGLIPTLAQVVYDDRELPAGTLRDDRLAILADAAEEAGCSDQQILGHLRGPGPHVRGCHVLDWILGRA